jgi:hypothetical protein
MGPLPMMRIFLMSVRLGMLHLMSSFLYHSVEAS